MVGMPVRVDDQHGKARHLIHELFERTHTHGRVDERGALRTEYEVSDESDRRGGQLQNTVTYGRYFDFLLRHGWRFAFHHDTPFRYSNKFYTRTFLRFQRPLK